MLFRIVNERTGEELAHSAWVADKPWNRMVGLLGRRGLADGRAIILRPADSIHTMFMRFSLDVLFLDRDRTVLRVMRDMRPGRLGRAKGAREVIEMASGRLPHDLEPGDKLRLETSTN